MNYVKCSLKNDCSNHGMYCSCCKRNEIGSNALKPDKFEEKAYYDDEDDYDPVLEELDEYFDNDDVESSYCEDCGDYHD